MSPTTDSLRIAILAAGAAGMYCGSCIRDNALAMALKRMGHDCVMIPLYTPVRTDTKRFKTAYGKTGTAGSHDIPESAASAKLVKRAATKTNGTRCRQLTGKRPR